MKSPDVAGAREWAEGYLALLLREHPYLFENDAAFFTGRKHCKQNSAYKWLTEFIN